VENDMVEMQDEFERTGISQRQRWAVPRNGNKPLA
jgi:hypothetical protein